MTTPTPLDIAKIADALALQRTCPTFTGYAEVAHTLRPNFDPDASAGATLLALSYALTRFKGEVPELEVTTAISRDRLPRRRALPGGDDPMTDHELLERLIAVWRDLIEASEAMS